MTQINTDCEEKENQSGTIQLIKGAFVLAWRVKQNKLNGEFLIKLSSINTIYPNGATENECLFYTYKDCCYFTELSIYELRRAIDSFIFHPETHWESYGYS